MFTYDVATTPGKVRLLSGDTNIESAAYSDEEIAVFLSLEGDSVFRAAALLLESAAVDEVRRVKIVTIGSELRVDSAAFARALTDRAASLRSRALQEDAETGGLDFAEMVFDPFGYQQQLFNNLLRD